VGSGESGANSSTAINPVPVLSNREEALVVQALCSCPTNVANILATTNFTAVPSPGGVNGAAYRVVSGQGTYGAGWFVEDAGAFAASTVSFAP